jgi:hypothetical protein
MEDSSRTYIHDDEFRGLYIGMGIVDTERGVNQYQVQFKNLFQLILKPFNYIQ